MKCSITLPRSRVLMRLLLTLIIAAGMCFAAAPAFAAKTPAKPANVKVTHVTDTSCQVKWKAAKSAVIYQIQYKKASAKKWNNSDTASETFFEITGLNCETKYKVRVRSINGKKKSSWSGVKSFTTKLQRPRAIWASHIDDHSITIMWTPSYHAKQYKVTWYQDNPDEDGKDPSKTVKGTSLSFNDLSEEGYYHFSVQAINGKKKSPANGIGLSTYSYEDGVTMDLMDYPTSPYVSLTRFCSGHDSFPGSEREFPALYTTDYDSEGSVTDDGYYFVDAKLQWAKLYYGTITQYNPSDAAHPFKQEITDETTYRIGDSITMPNGKTATITGLTMQLLPNVIFNDCEDSEEAYDRVEEYQLHISTDSGSVYEPTVSWTPWRVH